MSAHTLCCTDDLWPGEAYFHIDDRGRILFNLDDGNVLVYSIQGERWMLERRPAFSAMRPAGPVVAAILRPSCQRALREYFT